MASLSGPFRIDRPHPPRVFYTPRRGRQPHDCKPGVTVLAISGRHRRSSDGWVTMGYVCRQTPFGQGIGMGMKTNELRHATADEVRRALTRDHPHGAHFRPGCSELDDAGFALTMSSPTGPQGWTADRVRPGSQPIVPLTRTQIGRQARSFQEQYLAILGDWNNIASRQVEAVLASLG